MSYETAYMAINLGVLPAWLLLFFAPNLGLTKKLVHSGLYPALYSTLYAVLLARAMFFGVAADGDGMATVAGISAFFSHPNGVLIGWVHYLVFDLFVGSWIARDGARRGIPHYQLFPSLFFALMFGPVGLLLYMVLRKISGARDTDLQEQ